MYAVIDESLWRHPKLRRYAKARQIPKMHALGELAALYLYVLDQTQDGILRDCEPEEVEEELGFDGSPGQLVTAMLQVGLLDQTEAGLRVHNWGAWSGKWQAEKAERRVAERAKKQRQRSTKKKGESAQVQEPLNCPPPVPSCPPGQVGTSPGTSGDMDPCPRGQVSVSPGQESLSPNVPLLEERRGEEIRGDQIRREERREEGVATRSVAGKPHVGEKTQEGPLKASLASAVERLVELGEAAADAEPPPSPPSYSNSISPPSPPQETPEGLLSVQAVWAAHLEAAGPDEPEEPSPEVRAAIEWAIASKPRAEVLLAAAGIGGEDYWETKGKARAVGWIQATKLDSQPTAWTWAVRKGRPPDQRHPSHDLHGNVLTLPAGYVWDERDEDLRKRGHPWAGDRWGALVAKGKP